MIAAALVAAASLATTSWSGRAIRGAEADPALEAAVLARTIERFEARYVEDPLNPIVGAELADAHTSMFRLDNELGHLDRAETIAAELAPRALDAAPAHARLSATQLARHDFVQAIDNAERAVTADSTDEAALGALFDAAIAAGRYARADWALGRLETDHWATLAQRTRTSRWLDAEGHADPAYRSLHRACIRLEGRAVRRQVVAWCESMLGDLELGRSGPGAASRWYRRALETQPGYMAALEGLADLAHARGDWTEARALYLEIVADAHPDLSLRLAEVSRALGHTAQAERYERDFIRLATSPGAEPLNAHPLALYYAGRPETLDAALQVIERDLDRRQSVEAYEVLAWVHLQRGELAGALEASDRSRVWGVPSPSNDYVRGRILAGLGHTREAGELIGRATEDLSQLDHHVLAHLRG